jgi:hypothetical protein
VGNTYFYSGNSEQIPTESRARLDVKGPVRRHGRAEASSWSQSLYPGADGPPGSGIPSH